MAKVAKKCVLSNTKQKVCTQKTTARPRKKCAIVDCQCDGSSASTNYKSKLRSHSKLSEVSRSSVPTRSKCNKCGLATCTEFLRAKRTRVDRVSYASRSSSSSSSSESDYVTYRVPRRPTKPTLSVKPVASGNKRRYTRGGSETDSSHSSSSVDKSRPRKRQRPEVESSDERYGEIEGLNVNSLSTKITQTSTKFSSVARKDTEPVPSTSQGVNTAIKIKGERKKNDKATTRSGALKNCVPVTATDVSLAAPSTKTLVARRRFPVRKFSVEPNKISFLPPPSRSAVKDPTPFASCVSSYSTSDSSSTSASGCKDNETFSFPSTSRGMLHPQLQPCKKTGSSVNSHTATSFSFLTPSTTVSKSTAASGLKDNEMFALPSTSQGMMSSQQQSFSSHNTAPSSAAVSTRPSATDLTSSSAMETAPCSTSSSAQTDAAGGDQEDDVPTTKVQETNIIAKQEGDPSPSGRVPEAGEPATVAQTQTNADGGHPEAGEPVEAQDTGFYFGPGCRLRDGSSRQVPASPQSPPPPPDNTDPTTVFAANVYNQWVLEQRLAANKKKEVEERADKRIS